MCDSSHNNEECEWDGGENTMLNNRRSAEALHPTFVSWLSRAWIVCVECAYMSEWVVCRLVSLLRNHAVCKSRALSD